MVVLDAQALEAFFNGEPALEQVRQLLASGEQVIMSAANVAETADRMSRVFQADLARVRTDIDVLDIHITSVDSDVAFAAAELRATHYHRVRRPVSLADCVAAALALDRDARLATSDPHLIELVLDEGGQVVPLPGSDGRTWSG